MQIKVSQFRWHKQFHEIPWNMKCANFADTSSSMEFHGTRGAPISSKRAVPWNSVEFQWTLSAPISLTRKVPRATPLNSMEFLGHWNVPLHVPWNSMELLVSVKLAHSTFHGTARVTRLVHSKFHGIPWNCSCQRNWRTSSSMECHGTAGVSEIGAFLVPWNSVELLVSAKFVHLKFHWIPWNSMQLLVSAKLAHS